MRTIVFVAAASALVSACAAPQQPAGDGGVDAGDGVGENGPLARSYPPAWWGISDNGETLFYERYFGGDFSLTAVTGNKIEVVGRAQSAFARGFIQRGAQDVLVVSDLNPNRWPTLYTVFGRGFSPTEISRCSPARVSSEISIAGIDGAEFWVVFTTDCQVVCEDARVMVRVVLDGGVTFGPPVCNGPIWGNNYRARVVAHRYQRRVFEQQPGIPFRLVRFEADGGDVEVGLTKIGDAPFVEFLTDSSDLLVQERLPDAGLQIRELSLIDGGVVSQAGDFASLGLGELQSVQGTRSEVLVLGRGKPSFETNERVWVAAVRAQGRVRLYKAAVPLGSEAKAAPLPDGGLRGYERRYVRTLDGGHDEIHFWPLEFTPD
jgi:hypothetical protein